MCIIHWKTAKHKFYLNWNLDFQIKCSLPLRYFKIKFASSHSILQTNTYYFIFSTKLGFTTCFHRIKHTCMAPEAWNILDSCLFLGKNNDVAILTHMFKQTYKISKSRCIKCTSLISTVVFGMQWAFYKRWELQTISNVLWSVGETAVEQKC